MFRRPLARGIAKSGCCPALAVISIFGRRSGVCFSGFSGSTCSCSPICLLAVCSLTLTGCIAGSSDSDVSDKGVALERPAKRNAQLSSLHLPSRPFHECASVDWTSRCAFHVTPLLVCQSEVTDLLCVHMVTI